MLRHVLLSTALVGLFVAATGAQTPTPLHRWSFNDGTANDSIGTAHGTLLNGATVSGGQLQLNGINQYVDTNPINASITAKTLVGWVTLNNVTQQSGSVITLQNPTGSDVFDGIIYAERTGGTAAGGQWMSGSNSHLRSNGANNGGALQTSTSEVMMAIVYDALNNITLYRDGSLYATYNQGPIITYPGGTADVLFGLRHIDAVGSTGTAAGNDAYLSGQINEARIYGSALTAAQIQDLFAAGPNALATPEPTTIALWSVLGLVGTCAWIGWKKRQQ